MAKKLIVVFSKPSTIFGKIVKFFVGGEYSHIHFLYHDNSGQLYTFEAFPPKVRRKKGDIYSQDTQERFEIPLTTRKQRQRFNDLMLDHLGNAYGGDDAFRIFVRNRISRRLARWMKRKWDSERTEVCTTLAVKVLRIIWPRFGGEDAMNFTPDEVYAEFVERNG